MRTMKALAATLAVVLTPTVASATGVLDLAGLTGIRVYEATFTTTDATFAANDARLVATLDPLTAATRDFGFYPGDENYDIFVSNAAGQLDPHGGHVTIEGTCFQDLGCFNVSGVALLFGSTEVFANVLTHSIYGRDGSFIVPGSAELAVDGSLATFTRLGDTIGLSSSARMAITVGFDAASDPAAAPEPAAWALMIGGFAGIGGVMRRRRALSA